MSIWSILSACETAVGPARFADGMSGLQGAFLRAGARGVIATLWPVEDVYASQFAADFYRRYTHRQLRRAVAERNAALVDAAGRGRPGERTGVSAHDRVGARVLLAVRKVRGPPRRLGGIGGRGASRRTSDQ